MRGIPPNPATSPASSTASTTVWSQPKKWSIGSFRKAKNNFLGQLIRRTFHGFSWSFSTWNQLKSAVSCQVWFVDRCGCGRAERWPLHCRGFAREYPGPFRGKKLRCSVLRQGSLTPCFRKVMIMTLYFTIFHIKAEYFRITSYVTGCYWFMNKTHSKIGDLLIVT